ncbi:uncharacterized protein LOC116196452 [Punica granatum]|uniref:Uncharacterized protein LOC116196452 n=1 Tax=Punica granatum TaxID=22663 RepID=A0A6P8CG07_PUNGR|nr:uncharacterized protein LOC116196452 [Punica granatum]XP_031382040.1 uncharacterized protein LOC116196452 [Punica granatum]
MQRQHFQTKGSTTIRHPLTSRVCADCFNNSSKAVKRVTQASGGEDQVSASVSRLDINADKDSKAEPLPDHHPVPGVPECKCRMPLCICEAPSPSTDGLAQQKILSNAQSVPKDRTSTSNSKSSSVFNVQEVHVNSEKPKMEYAANGEGLRGNKK